MLLWNADNFVFKILLHRNRTFSAISLLRNVRSASNEGFAGRKWMFLCLRGGGGYVNFARIPSFTGLENTCKFCPNQRGRTGMLCGLRNGTENERQFITELLGT